MKLIIDIPYITYDAIMSRDWKNAGWLFSEELKAIHGGTPLPKGHGRLKDVDELYNSLEFPTQQFASAFKQVLDDAPTIIEADTEESDTDNKSDDELYADAIDTFKVYVTGRK